MKKIIEAAPREFMTKREQVLKKKLIALLRNDGKGHRHAKFAARLEDFIIKIVSLEDDPDMTAAVDFDDATIYISEGFLTDPETFFQLNVLMRHELAHYLMMHQIRMMDKLISVYGKEGAERIRMSKSIHELLNIIEDFEISNKRYTEDDKLIVKHMKLNFREISGLVTETIRKDWQNLSVLEMYDMLSREIEAIQNSLRYSWDYSSDLQAIGAEGDWLKTTIANTAYTYADEKSRTNFLGSIEDFIKNRALYHFAVYDSAKGPCIVKFSSLPENFQNIVKDIYEIIVNNIPTRDPRRANDQYEYSKDTVKKMIKTIVRSSPFEVLKMWNPSYNNPTFKELFTLYTPEEKFIAVDTLKAMLPTLELYQTWYDKVKRVLGDISKYSVEELQKILDELNK